MDPEVKMMAGKAGKARAGAGAAAGGSFQALAWAGNSPRKTSA